MFVVCKYYEQITQMLFPNIKILCAPPKDYIYTEKHTCGKHGARNKIHTYIE